MKIKKKDNLSMVFHACGLNLWEYKAEKLGPGI